MTAILALDLGTNTGFAILRADGRIESGTERFNVRGGESSGDRFNRFRRWLVEIKQAHEDVARVVYEDVVFIGGGKAGGFNGAATMQLYGGFRTVVEMFAAHHRLEIESFGVSTVKKRFAGSGKAQKVDVVNQCKALGFNPGTDNEADAIALLHVATDRCPLLTMNGATPKKRQPKRAPELVAGADPF